MSEVLTLADKVFQELTTAIVRGEIKPGTKLSEQALVERYGGSRAPIREAIQKLEARSLVVRVPNAGARVISLSLAELESMACRLAAQRMTDEEIAQLYTLLLEHKENIKADSGLSYYQKAGDLDFHFRIIQGSKNARLQQMLSGELYHLVRMYRYQTSTNKARPEQAYTEHYRIVEAIEARDSELAELLMRRHIQKSINNLEKQLGNAPSA